MRRTLSNLRLPVRRTHHIDETLAGFAYLQINYGLNSARITCEAMAAGSPSTQARKSTSGPAAMVSPELGRVGSLPKPPAGESCTLVPVFVFQPGHVWHIPHKSDRRGIGIMVLVVVFFSVRFVHPNP